MPYDKDQEELVEKTVHKTLTTIGFDLSEPIELQKDMAYLRDVRLDRKMRSNTAQKVFMGVLIPACMIASWEFIKSSIK